MDALLLLLVGCKADETAPDFDESFEFGAAMAGFQVEPGCPTIPPEDCEDRTSDWYQWVTDPELVALPSLFVSGDPLALGPGHYELYEEDLDRAKDELGLDTVRVSLEWSRLFPTEPTGTDLAQEADQKAVAYYRGYLEAIRARGLEPLVTLNHYTLPLWIHDGKACHFDIAGCEDRGWADPERIVPAIAAYAGFAGATFGDLVDRWATLNEPLALVVSAYFQPSPERTNPPGIVDPALALEVLYNQAEGHAAMVEALHATDASAEVGVVVNLLPTKPKDPGSEADQLASEHLDYVFNRAFLQAAIDGDFDRDLDGVVEESHPEIAGRTDWIGVNFYTGTSVVGLGFPYVKGYPFTDFYPTDVGEEEPERFPDMLAIAAEYGLPLWVTENGTTASDDQWSRYFDPHLRAVKEAVDGGMDLRGYYVWSLIDNYEWNLGMSMKFGMYEVDTTTKKRALRDAGARYQELVETHRLPE